LENPETDASSVQSRLTKSFRPNFFSSIFSSKNLDKEEISELFNDYGVNETSLGKPYPNYYNGHTVGNGMAQWDQFKYESYRVFTNKILRLCCLSCCLYPLKIFVAEFNFKKNYQEIYPFRCTVSDPAVDLKRKVDSKEKTSLYDKEATKSLHRAEDVQYRYVI